MSVRSTVARPTRRFNGVGLHSGNSSWIEIHPSPQNARGIIFRSHSSGAEVAAIAANVVSTNRSTCLGSPGFRVETVEHVLSALNGFGVTDAVVIVDGAELPIGDGSSLPFVEMLEEVGIVANTETVVELSLTRPVVVSDGRGSVMTAVPSETFWVTAVLDYSGFPSLGVLAATYNGMDYKSSISAARTYGFHHELDALRSAGLGLGASLENVVALGDDGAPDPRTPLRMFDEIVRHKILDIIGDLSLVGKKLNIGLVGLRPSHSVNIQLAKALLDQGESIGEK